MPPTPPKPVQKQLIVVVHGVGIRAAGESSDLVAAALDGAPRPDPGPAEPRRPRFRRRASDDFLLFETETAAPSRLFHPYPARLTRFRSFRGKFPDQDSPERVISDFYWGDVGGFASSMPAVVVGLGRIMLGLAHVVRENALTVFPDPISRLHAALRALARGAALAIHGPIFALNITLLLGLGFIMLLGDRTNLVSVLTALACLLLAWRLQRRSQSFLLRHMGAYLALCGLLLLLFAALDALAPTPPDPSLRAAVADDSPRDRLIQMSRGAPDAPAPGAFVIPILDHEFRTALCSWKTASAGSSRDSAVRDDRQFCLQMHSAGPFLHAMRLQGMMVLIWSGVALVTLFFGLRWLWTVAWGDGRHRRDILMPTLSLMTLLWFLLIGLGWAAIAAAYAQIGPGPLWQGAEEARPTCGLLALIAGACEAGTDHTKIFTTSLRGIWAAGATLAALIVVGLLVFLSRRSALRGMTPATYMADADRNADRARLIVPSVLCAALGTMPVAILWLIAASSAFPPDYCDSAAPGKLVCWLEANTTSVLTWIVAVIAGGLPILLRPLTLGINVAGDVIIYLNDFHWRRAPGAPPSRTFAEILCPPLERLRQKPLHPVQGYAYRQRIQKRLRGLVADLIRTEEPDRIDFVCHSQGTVITLDVLSTKGAFWGRGRRLGLVTMGSPWRHLYHRYFPASFPDLATPPPGVARWTNIFRIDDFIGTHVRRATPDEVAIATGGHTNYWRDDAVRQILHDRLEPGP